jgi:hypothetical protein
MSTGLPYNRPKALPTLPKIAGIESSLRARNQFWQFLAILAMLAIS